jgi:hypothetical protein
MLPFGAVKKSIFEPNPFAVHVSVAENSMDAVYAALP